jgi:2'-5' RNA ligase
MCTATRSGSDVRLFAAVDVDATVLAHLAAAVPALGADARMPPVERWHLTVAFYGEVPTDKLDELSTRLGRVASRTVPLQLALAGGGTFPKSPRAARVLWCGVTGDVDELTRLAARSVAVGRRIGLPMERRQFRPHLTIARARARTADFSQAAAALAGYVGRGWRVSGLRLVRSQLGPDPRYETVGRWPLGAIG